MNTYPHYKPSGIDWIGEIPEHWEVKKLKYVDLVIMGQSPDSEDYLDDEKATPFLQGNADFGQLFPIPRVYCNAVSKTSRQNDILLSVRAPIGAINISDKEYGIGRGLCAVRALTSNYKFLFYHMIIKHEELNSIGTGSTYKAVTVENVKSTNLIFPPLSEQTAIANYLDRKTAEIDQTIADKEALIGLYEEEKKGLINEAVTKGLNPNVPLKDSNIEWLGDVPAHWEVKKLKQVSSKIGDGIHATPEYVDSSDFYFINGNNLNEGVITISESTKSVSEEEFEKYKLNLNYGTVLICRIQVTNATS